MQVLKSVAPFQHSWVDDRVGSMEDAALLRPESGSNLVFTVDFITPIVDEPEAFGAIAAANALSDVYAMGGEPQVALAVCGFPSERVPLDVLSRIFRGGRDKAAEAGCAIAGGHTVQDPELKYGLCVIGSVPPDRVLTQAGGRPGDRLVLTKPIGFGVAAQAIKSGTLPAGDLERVIALMSTLNRDARDAALACGVQAATDVTGFGLLGHLHHLAQASGCAARLFAPAVPHLEMVPALIEAGQVPGGSKNNLAYAAPFTRFEGDVSPAQRLLLADAQTSGGLLLAVPPEREAELVRALGDAGTPERAVIGELRAGAPGHCEVVAAAP